MSEESPENYNSGDVVWVKLGASWWPGEVKDVDELPNEMLDFKKPPLVIVKFFDEDSYEYVKTWGSIYPYNSEKKNEFIKKGMAAFRAKVPHMEKFPKDVLTAEVRMGGNPNILSEPMFLPEKKRNYVAEVFGTPSPKSKGNKEKKRSSTNKSSSQKDTAHITHRRFLGVDDYRAYICIQYPGKDRVAGDREDDEVLRINREPEQEFNCHTCSFTTKRLEVMILHTKSHIQGVYVSSPRKTKHPAIRRKKDKMKKSRSSDDVVDSDSTSSDSDYAREKKRKSKLPAVRKPKIKKPEPPKEQPKTSRDIQSELLAVWDDSDEDEEFELSLNRSTHTDQNLSQSITDIILGRTPTNDAEPETTDADTTLNRTGDQSGTSTDLKAEAKNENDGDDVAKKPSDLERDTEPKAEDVNKSEIRNEEPSNLSTEEPVNESSVSDVLESGGLKESTDDSASRVLDDEESRDGEETSREAPAEKTAQKMNKDIREAIKSCFDFDEDDDDDSAVMGRTATGRKIPRVIPPAERRKSQEPPKGDDAIPEPIPKEPEQLNKKAEIVEEARSEDVDAAFKELMEMMVVPELPDVQNTLKCEQNFHNIKTIKFPDKPDAIGPSRSDKKEPDAIGSSRPDKKEPGDVAAKLINPKKRFVKSFEDFELMQNEMRRREEEAIAAPAAPQDDPKDDDLKDDYPKDDDDYLAEEDVELSTLKSNIMSKIIEEAKIDDESKNKIMSKIQDAGSRAKPEEPSVNSSEEVKTGSHRTPRSKILELYRNDANKQKAEEGEKRNNESDVGVNIREEKVEDRLRETLIRSEVVPPKKGKWSRRGSHPKKDRNAFVLASSSFEDVVTSDPVPKTAEKEEKINDLTPVDNGTPADATPSGDAVTVPIVQDEENPVKETVKADEIDKSSPEEDRDKITSNIEKDAKVEERETETRLPEKVDTLKSEEGQADSTMQEEIVNKIVVEKPLDYFETTEAEKSTVPVEETVEEVMKEAEPADVIEKEPESLPLNKEIADDQQFEGLNDAVYKSEVPEILLAEQQVTRSPKEEALAGTVDVTPNAEVPDVDKSDANVSNANVSNVSLGEVGMKSEEVQEATGQTEWEQPQPSSPQIDVVAPPSPAAPKDAICSPPKKSKKRKMSETLPADDAAPPKPDARVEDSPPAEKKKKDTDAEGSTPTAEHSETVDGFRAHKSDMTAEGEAATPKPAQDDLAEHTNELEIQCGSSSPESFKFSIQTNLSNLTSREEISALALATLSEIKADLETTSDSSTPEEKIEQAAVDAATAAVTPVPAPAPVDSELVPIEGNLTVVSERDLADGQVEITSEQVISPKRPVTLSNFSMDFSDSASDSNSNSTNDTLADLGRCTDFSARGTEFPPKAMTKQIKKVDRKKENAYERLELLNILEGNSDSERKAKDGSSRLVKRGPVDDICDFEEHIPSQIVCTTKLKRDISVDREYPYTEKVKSGEKSTTSKLLERLTVSASKSEMKEPATRQVPRNQATAHTSIKISKIVGKVRSPATVTKPIILSEQIVRPAAEAPRPKLKKPLNDIEDVEAFVIHKDPKRNQDHEALDATQSQKTAGKAKILQQTIITPAGEIIQPTVNQAQTDDNIFDINAMPIVLSDEILTPESIENMPIMIGSETKATEGKEKPTPKRPVQNRIITKTTTVTVAQPTPPKNQIIVKQGKTPRILQTVGSKTIKAPPTLANTTKPGKYIILPQSGVQAAKYVAKKTPLVKRTNIVPKTTAIAPEPSGNKIMIVTNQQGQQQRLLLTPAQQKMIGYQNQKATKTLVKGNIMQKSVLATKSVPLFEAGTSGVISKSPSLIGQKVVVGTSPSTGLLATTSPQIVGGQGRVVKGITKKFPPMTQKLFSGTNKMQKTILIKNQHGQTVRKIQGTDDELLDKQVAEQLEAIKASSGMKFSSQPKQAEPYKPKAPVRRSYSKKVEPKAKSIPPLASVQPPPKPEPPLTLASLPTKKPVAEPVESKPTSTLVAEEMKPPQDRPLNQLVIQDAVGNQTTITEGQILALPSETVDGQPQSYMLVTLDESGNLTPLNSEALMSLDPNLGLGGDLSNMVLQIDQGALSDRQTIAVKATVGSEPPKMAELEPTVAAPVPVSVPEASITTEITETVVERKAASPAEPMPSVVPSTNGDPGQQLIVTGDPIATQKFLESLTEGTTDLANILANAEGNSILIQADGQQILINTNSDNQMLLSVNNDNLNVSESTEGGGNPIFATQPSKNQDILAAALADTDVFQQEQHAAQSKITSQLSPNNALYPMNVSNVLETSLTLSSPIMTPLEVPSTNSKKIPDDEADILTQVPKNVDLPITITDPNISQTVASQQVASMIANELQTNLELALPVSDSAISSVSTDMNSPSYVYSLPTLDDVNQKPFNSSMPLLNEDIEDAAKPKEDDKTEGLETVKEESNSSNSEKPQVEVTSENSFLEEEEGRFTLGGEMCSSLSEPPPEMFDLPEDNQNLLGKRNSNIPSSLQSTPDVSDNASKDGDMTDMSTHAESSNEGSCEIPIQPRIMTKSLDLSENLSSLKRSLQESDEEETKRCKFD